VGGVFLENRWTIEHTTRFPAPPAALLKIKKSKNPPSSKLVHRRWLQTSDKKNPARIAGIPYASPPHLPLIGFSFPCPSPPRQSLEQPTPSNNISARSPIKFWAKIKTPTLVMTPAKRITHAPSSPARAEQFYLKLRALKNTAQYRSRARPAFPEKPTAIQPSSSPPPPSTTSAPPPKMLYEPGWFDPAQNPSRN